MHPLNTHIACYMQSTLCCLVSLLGFGRSYEIRRRQCPRKRARARVRQLCLRQLSPRDTRAAVSLRTLPLTARHTGACQQPASTQAGPLRVFGRARGRTRTGHADTASRASRSPAPPTRAIHFRGHGDRCRGHGVARRNLTQHGPRTWDAPAPGLHPSRLGALWNGGDRDWPARAGREARTWQRCSAMAVACEVGVEQGEGVVRAGTRAIGRAKFASSNPYSSASV